MYINHSVSSSFKTSLVGDQMSVGQIVRLCGWIVEQGGNTYLMDGKAQLLVKLNNYRDISNDRIVIVFGTVKEDDSGKLIDCKKVRIVATDREKHVFELEHALSNKTKKHVITKYIKCHLCKLLITSDEENVLCHCNTPVHDDCFLGDGDSCQSFKS